MGTAISCTKCSQVTSLVHTTGSSSSVVSLTLFVQLSFENCCYDTSNCNVNVVLWGMIILFISYH